MSKKRKLVLVSIFLIICLSIIIYVIQNIEVEMVNEISPAEEISKEDEEMISIKGYYFDIELNDVVAKEINVNINLIKDNMYVNVLNEIMKSNENENLESIGEIIDLKVDRINVEGRIANIRFINEINQFEQLEVEKRNIVINMLKQTLKEINEIEDIKLFFNEKEYVFM